MKKHYPRFSLVCGIALATAMHLATAAALPQALLDCAAERDDALRLACYDAQIDATGKRRQAGVDESAAASNTHSRAGTTAPGTAAGPSDPALIDEFGMTGELARKTRPAEEQPALPESITAIITRMEEKPRGQRVVHLDNNQVWEERTRTRNLSLDVGDRITIEAGALGSFKLIGPGGKRSTGVSRTR